MDSDPYLPIVKPGSAGGVEADRSGTDPPGPPGVQTCARLLAERTEPGGFTSSDPGRQPGDHDRPTSTWLWRGWVPGGRTGEP
jgi:hypothetical protein